MLKKIILEEVQKLKLNSKLEELIKTRLKSPLLIRDKNSEDHFCSFIVPFDRKSKKIFLGHHKKANDWIPPGGHIEKDETPVEAAIREAKEELGITIAEKDLELFTLDYLDVSAPNKICKMHWHIWYLFETEETNYKFDAREFYDAGWFTDEDILKKVKSSHYRKLLLQFYSPSLSAISNARPSTKRGL